MTRWLKSRSSRPKPWMMICRDFVPAFASMPQFTSGIVGDQMFLSAFGLCLCETGWRLGPRTVANAFYVCVLLNMFERQICEFDLAMISQSQCMWPIVTHPDRTCHDMSLFPDSFVFSGIGMGGKLKNDWFRVSEELRRVDLSFIPSLSLQTYGMQHCVLYYDSLSLSLSLYISISFYIYLYFYLWISISISISISKSVSISISIYSLYLSIYIYPYVSISIYLHLHLYLYI